MLKIESWLEIWLSKQPEYRMGYQKAVVTLNTGGKETGIIINSQIFLKGTDYPWQMFMDWDSVLKETQKSALKVIDANLIPREPETLKGVREIVIANEKNRILANRRSLEASYARAKGDSRYYQLLSESENFTVLARSAAAEDAPITLTELGQIFKRFSAYANDKRITSGKGLTSGTFATTKEDADANIRTGADAVARYALPNTKPACNVFTISPAKDTEVKRGTAQPANSQPGGGVEVIFVTGLPDGTVTGPITITEK
jgi:hypothetical protein